MMNRSTERSPFSILYTKEPNHKVNVAILPKCQNTSAICLSNEFKSVIEETRSALQQANNSYKATADQHKRAKQFNTSDLVMVPMRKERYPIGQYSKLHPIKLGSFSVRKQINDNDYIIDLPPNIQTSATFIVFDIYDYHTPDDTITDLI